MGAGFLMDTNTVIDLLNQRLPAASMAWMRRLVTLSPAVLSVISRIELLSYRGPADEMAQVAQFLAAASILPLDEPVIQETIRLRQLYRRKLPDAIIAAKALVYDLTVVTRNVADFAAIANLRVLNPHEAATLPNQ
jgi:toxin FitB